LVTDDIKGSDNMFSALLIDAKDSKLSGRGSYVRTSVGTSELPRVALALSKQLEVPERKHRTPAPARSYPAEMDIEMVFVKGGTFTMGCLPERDGTCGSNEKAHSVTLNNFYIGKYEITQAQWVAVMGNNPSANKSDEQQPVSNVTWLMADTFITRLNKATSKQYRLPTEAEWEYAARGGAQQEGYKYSGSNDINEVGWWSGNSGTKPHPVGQKKPNALGIYDMTCNVWEFVSDRYASYPAEPQDNPKGPTSGNERIRRGSAFPDAATPYPRNAARIAIAPTFTDGGIGFRVAMDY
jgi:formylglycine-generating enzyme required for sulfatase activity